MRNGASAGPKGSKNIQSVAIIGSGPAGASLATYLGRAGLDVVLFHQDKQQPVIVGESLVPAIVPYLRRLGIEEEVAGYSVYKKGATFVLNPEQEMSVFFDQVRGAKTPYSYNVPREKFDASILNVARRHATVVDYRAGCVRDGDSDRVLLDSETLARCSDVLDGQPDLIVDSAGRARILGNLMEVEIVQVERADTKRGCGLRALDAVAPRRPETNLLIGPVFRGGSIAACTNIGIGTINWGRSGRGNFAASITYPLGVSYTAVRGMCVSDTPTLLICQYFS